MSAPVDFLKIFAGQLRGAGIPFAITSGMACVHYGLPQDTKEAEWSWPTSEPFWMQHKRAVQAAHQHELPANPLADIARDDLVRAALLRLADMGFPQNEVARVVPPLDELLP
jgi:hypothetical protein